MKNIVIAYCFAVSLIYCAFSLIGWSWDAGTWSMEMRTVFGVFVFMFWIAFWMKIEHDREVW